DGKPQRQPERAAVSGRTERGGQRECCDRHQMIRAEAVNETESEHGAAEHGGIIAGQVAVAFALSLDIHSCICVRRGTSSGSWATKPACGFFAGWAASTGG